ncbi:MAG: DNA-binding protein [Planctomycetes bacterium]|jgi:hypothetical protein|nr:DNA-binding protein [Planctomycetota bacterium]
MKIKRFDNFFVVRLDKGEEVVTTLTGLCRAEKIKLGAISGLGATNRATLGLYNTAAKKYQPREFIGDFEIASLNGNITTMNGDTYLHLHAVLGDERQNAFAGHLTAAVISATAEIIIAVIEGSVERFFDENIGLNLLKIE